MPPHVRRFRTITRQTTLEPGRPITGPASLAPKTLDGVRRVMSPSGTALRPNRSRRLNRQSVERAWTFLLRHVPSVGVVYGRPCIPYPHVGSTMHRQSYGDQRKPSTPPRPHIAISNSFLLLHGRAFAGWIGGHCTRLPGGYAARVCPDSSDGAAAMAWY